ncbi:MAG: dTDP-4-amino-4,6-dideoxyglucose formyltransferase [Pseudomonadota bacterium]
MKTLIITDNQFAAELSAHLADIYGDIEIYQSPNGPLEGVPRIDVKAETDWILGEFGLVVSMHSKQIFPSKLVNGVRCINVHPGLNPYNRGWFPQVFSIINGMPMGVTIHEIDEELDNGPIIAQQPYDVKSWDTSGSVYRKIMEMERELVLQHFESILNASYSKHSPKSEGNLNLKRDFDELKQLDLDEEGTFRDFLNRLRALTHDEFKNAYFVDESSGRRVFVRVLLEPE